MPVDAGSISSDVRIKLSALNADIAACSTAFDNLGAEFTSQAEKYSNIAGMKYANALKTIAKESKNVAAAAKAGALTEQEAVNRLIALRKTELEVLQKRAISEQGSNKSTITAIQNTQQSISSLTEKQKLLAGETNKTSSAFDKLKGIAGAIGAGISVAAAIGYVKKATVAFAEAEASAQRLDLALKFNNLEDAREEFEALAKQMQRLGVAGDDEVRQLEAELVQMGRNKQQILDLIKASAGLSAVNGESLRTNLEQVNKTYEGLVPRQGAMRAALDGLTEGQLRNGEGVKMLLEKYAPFIGTVGETTIALKNTKETLGDVSEEVGEVFKPAIIAGTNIINNLLGAFIKAPDIIKVAAVVIGGVAVAATAAIPVLGAFGIALSTALPIVGIAAAAIAAIGIAGVSIAKGIDKANNPIKYFTKEIESAGANAMETATQLNEYEKASNDLLTQAKKNNAQDKLTKEQADKLIAMYPGLVGQIDLYSASLADVAVKLKEVQRIETEWSMFPLIKNYQEQESAVNKVNATIADYKRNYEELMSAQKKKTGSLWNAQDVAIQSAAMMAAYKKGMDEYSDQLSMAIKKRNIVIDEINRVALSNGLVFDVATGRLREMTAAEVKAADASKKTTAVWVDKGKAEEEWIAARVKAGQIEEADRKRAVEGNNKAIESADEYKRKLAELNGQMSDTIEMERLRAIETIRASGASTEAMKEAEDAVNAYFAALKDSKSVDDFKKKAEELRKTATTIASSVKGIFDAIVDAIEQSMNASSERLAEEAEKVYESMTEAAEAAYEKQTELEQTHYDEQSQFLDDWYSLRQELIENDGKTEMEVLQANLAEAIAAGDTETAAEVQKQIALINLQTDYEAQKKALDDKAAADKEAREKAYEDAKAARELEYEKKKAKLEYDAALGAWRIQVATSIANAAITTLNGFMTQPFVPAGIIAGAAAAIIGGIQVAAVAGAKPQPPQLATGGIVLPQSGGVPTVQAENGYAELDLNGGPSGRAFLSEFARAIAAEMGGGGNGGNVTIHIPISLDGKAVAESTVSYINNGQVRMR